MTSNKYVYILFALLFLSFDSLAEIRKIVSSGRNSNIVEECLGYTIGDYFDTGSLPSVTGKKYQSGNYSFECMSSQYNGGIVSVNVLRDDRRWFTGSFSTNGAASCPDGQEINPTTGKCEDKPCPEGQHRDEEGQCTCNDGSKPNMLGVCDDYCNSEEYQQLRREKLIMCSNTGGKFSSQCNSRTDVTFSCDKKSDPDGGGDDGDGGDGTGGGTGDGGDGTGGGSGDGGDGTGDNQDFGQVVNAIDNMRTDNNTRLDKLLSRLDVNSSNEAKSLDGISDSIAAASDKNEQSLDQINSSIGNLNNTLRDSNNIARELSSNEVSAIDGVNSSIGRLDSTLKGLADDITSTNSSSVGVGVCGVGTCESFYTAKYPEGVQGVISTHYNSISGTVTSGIKNVFGTVNLSGGSRPAYSASLDFGFANYGTFDIYREAHLNVVFTFLRAFFLVCCIFYCRSLVFGG